GQSFAEEIAAGAQAHGKAAVVVGRWLRAVAVHEGAGVIRRPLLDVPLPPRLRVGVRLPHRRGEGTREEGAFAALGRRRFVGADREDDKKRCRQQEKLTSHYGLLIPMTIILRQPR